MTQLAIWFTLLIIAALLIIALPILRKQTESNPLVQKSLISALIATPIVALGGYFYLGTPQFAEMQANPEPPKIVSLADALHEKLKKNPSDLAGWLMLGRSYMIEERIDESIEAFENALKLQADNVEAMLPLADALAVKANGQLLGRPYELLKKSHQLNPDNKMVMWLLGMAEKQQNQPEAAQRLWLKLYNEMPQDDPDRPIIAKLLKSVGYGGVFEPVEMPNQVAAEQQDKPSQTTTSDTPKNHVSIEIPDYQQLIASYPNSTVFIYAKAISGMPMPILARKLPVSDLKEQMELGEQDLIMANRPLLDQAQFIVGIRITEQNAVNNQTPLFKQEQQVTHGQVVHFSKE